MSRWSGLGPAVNTHIKRWNTVTTEWDRIDQMFDKGGIAILPTRQFPIAGEWDHFAKSWGIPQADGSVLIMGEKVDDSGTIHGRQQWNASEASRASAHQFMRREAQMLHSAETVYVTAEIIDAIDDNSQTMQPEPLWETDLFTPSGLAFFERPLLVPDLHPLTGEATDYLHVGIRALGWVQIDNIGAGIDVGAKDNDGSVITEGDYGPGIMMFLYTTPDDFHIYRDSYLRAVEKGLIDIGKDRFDPDHQKIVDPRFAGVARDALLINDVLPWRYGRDWTIRPQPFHEPGKVDGVVAHVRRWVLTLMRFCWQRILVPHRSRVSPKTLKKLEGITRGRPRRDFTVLRLRRAESTSTESDATGTGVPLGYRSRTRGHWRRQYYPSLGPARSEDGSFNQESHRLIPIEPFWRGPADAPLGPLHSATVVVR